MRLNRKTRYTIQRRAILSRRHARIARQHRYHCTQIGYWEAKSAQADIYPEFLLEMFAERASYHTAQKGVTFRELVQIERQLDPRMDRLWTAVLAEEPAQI